MDDLDKFCCQNKNCTKHGIRGEKNIHVRAVYGPNKTRLLYCTVCKKKFAETRGTIFFDARLPKEKVVSLLKHVVEGNGRAEDRTFAESRSRHRKSLHKARR